MTFSFNRSGKATNACALVLTALLFVAAAPVSGQQGPPPTPVKVAQVQEELLFETISLVGTTEARRRSAVAAQTAGAVEEVLVEEGDRVSRGDVLVRLDTDALGLELAGAKAERDQLTAQYKEQQENLKRSETLFERGRIAEETYKSDLYREEGLQAALAAAEASIDLLQDRIDRAAIKAPLDGVVAARILEPGEYVAEGDPAAEVLDLSRVDVMFDLPERYATDIRRDADIPVQVAAVSGTPFKGRIIALIPDADPESQTLPLKVGISNEDGRLMAGLFATAAVPLKIEEKALVVPKDALVAQGPRNTVFVVEDGTARGVPVERGRAIGSRVAVEGDLQAGQKVVILGNERIRDGQSVRILQEGESPAPEAEPESAGGGEETS